MQTETCTVTGRAQREPDREHEEIALLLRKISELEKQRNSAEANSRLEQYYRLLLKHLQKL